MVKYVNKIEWYDEDETYELEAYFSSITLRMEYNYKWIVLKHKDYKTPEDINLIDIYNNFSSIAWDEVMTESEIEEEKKDIDGERMSSRLRRKADKITLREVNPMASQPENPL